MNETTLEWIQFLKLILLACYSVLYGFGGMSGKWKRRFVAPFVVTVGLCGLSLWSGTFSWWFVGWFPLLSVALHLGYGSSDFWTKVKKRAYCGLALGCAAIPIAMGTGSWALFGIHVFVCVLISVSFGVFNITSSARTEETFLAAMTCALPLAMI